MSQRQYFANKFLVVVLNVAIQNVSIGEFRELWKNISNMKFMMLLQLKKKNTGLLHIRQLHCECHWFYWQESHVLQVFISQSLKLIARPC